MDLSSSPAFATAPATWLVTGGAGFIGSRVARAILETTPHRVVVLDALTYAGNPANLADLAGDPRYVFAHGSIGDAELVARLLAEHQIDAVVNFAAESHVDPLLSRSLVTFGKRPALTPWICVRESPCAQV